VSDANDEALLSRLVGALASVPSVEAIALGGSRASTQGAFGRIEHAPPRC
jgi:hypothetical protein